MAAASVARNRQARPSPRISGTPSRWAATGRSTARSTREPLLRGLSKRGQTVALAQILDPHLIWRSWRPGDPLAKGRLGVKEPRADANAFRRLPIVPLACFDRRGGRVGYGKGHFDRTIAALAARRPVLAIGLGYAIQEIPRCRSSRTTGGSTSS